MSNRVAIQNVAIKNVGPIESVSIPIPAGGGVVVLRGRNGSGKTQALDATAALIRGEGSLSVRDREPRGEVDGFGARITVGHTTRRTGELECLSLEGRLNVADLVDPGIKDAVAADAKRIRALVSLTGAAANPETFREAVGAELFDAAVGEAATAADDLLDMAGRVKRDLEKVARAREQQADTLHGKACGLRETARDVDLEAECDPHALQRRFEDALAAEAALRQRKQSAERAATRREDAMRRLMECEAANVQSVTAAEAELDDAATHRMAALRAVERLEKLLGEARTGHGECEARYRRAEDALRAAQGHASVVTELRQIVADTAALDAPEPAAIERATADVAAAREAIETGAAVRRAKDACGDAEALDKRARAARDDAGRCRDAAAATDDVLSQAVACDLLRVEGGRLWCAHATRGRTLYCELSHGERWKVALDIAAARVGTGGVIVVPQEAWEALDPANRVLVAEHVRTRRVVLLTAEATTGELRAEEYAHET